MFEGVTQLESYAAPNSEWAFARVFGKNFQIQLVIFNEVWVLENEIREKLFASNFAWKQILDI